MSQEKAIFEIADKVTKITQELFISTQKDKNIFYQEACKKYMFPNELVILNQIINLCPIK